MKGSRLLVADDGHHRIVELDADERAPRPRQRGRRAALPLRRRARRPRRRLRRRQQPAPDRPARPSPEARPRAGGARAAATGSSSSRARSRSSANGNLLVADAGNDRVQEFGATRRLRPHDRPQRPRATPHVTAPADVAANGLGEVAVADGNGRISWFSLGGAFFGGWAQSRSFQQSTAVVASPNRHRLRDRPRGARRDGGERPRVRRRRGPPAAAQRDRRRPGAPRRSTSAPTAPLWAAQGTGRFARVADAGRDPDVARRRAPARPARPTRSPSWPTGRSPSPRAPRRTRRARRRHRRPLRPDRPPHRDLDGPAPGRRPGRRAPERPRRHARRRRLGRRRRQRPRAAPHARRARSSGRSARPAPAPASSPSRAAWTLDCAGGLLVADSRQRPRSCASPTSAPPRPAAAARRHADRKGLRPPAPVGLRPADQAPRAGARAAAGHDRRDLPTDLHAGGQSARPSAYSPRARVKTSKATTTRTGTRSPSSVSATTAAAMRAALRAGGSATAGVVVTATARDGVADTAAVRGRSAERRSSPSLRSLEAVS